MRTMSYCKDSDSFVRRLATVMWEELLGRLLFAIDVVKLYPSIIHVHCVQTLRWYLRRHRFPRAEFVCDMVFVILTYNYCEFDGEIWRQVTGYGTGVANAAEVANLYLNDSYQSTWQV